MFGFMISLRRNSFWLLFARISTLGLAVLFVALVARRLGTAGFGQFTFIAAVVLIGNVFTSFGTDTLIIRETAKAGYITSLAARAFTLQIVLSGVWCFAIFIFGKNNPLLIYSLSLFPLALFSITSALLRAFERMDLFWGLSIINGFIQIVCAVLSPDLSTLCIFLLMGNIVTALLALAICFVSLPGFNLFPFLDFRPLVRVALPFATLATLGILSQRLGVLSVSILAGDVAAGLFSSAARIVEGMKLGHYAVLGALLPALSRNTLDSKHDNRAAFLGLLGISVLIAGATIFLANPILNFIFGDKYTSAVSLLIVLIWTLLPYTISAFISVDLVVRGLEYTLVKATIISLVIYASLYFLLINSNGLLGAAWAALLGECLQAVILILFYFRNLSERGLQSAFPFIKVNPHE